MKPGRAARLFLLQISLCVERNDVSLAALGGEGERVAAIAECARLAAVAADDGALQASALPIDINAEIAAGTQPRDAAFLPGIGERGKATTGWRRWKPP